MEVDYKRLSILIRLKAREKGITIHALAIKLDIPYSTLRGNIENNSPMHLGVYFKVRAELQLNDNIVINPDDEIRELDKKLSLTNKLD